MCVARHAQTTQNSTFAMSLRYLQKDVGDEVDFLHGDKHKSFLQADFNILSVKVFYKVILSLLMGMIKQCQITQSNKLAIALKYLKNEVSHKPFK